jgi:hypothetical protein
LARALFTAAFLRCSWTASSHNWVAVPAKAQALEEDLSLNTTKNVNPRRFSAAAAAGLRVFPAKARSKKPATDWKRYQQEQPTNGDLLKWDLSPCNVCVVTGSPSGIVVVDVDSPEAQRLIDSLGLPLTPTVRTARGCHLYFKAPPYEVRNSVNIEGVKLDIRGDGGYVVGPGSIHPDGAAYEWLVSPDEAAFAPFPGQLAEMIGGRNRKKHTAAQSVGPAKAAQQQAEGLDAFLQSELEEAQAEISGAPNGERNDTLFKMAARMARHVSAAKVAWNSFAEALASVARDAGLEEGEIASTLESGWTRGSAEPTAWVQVAREHVYLSYQERFYHVPSGKDLKPTGFNGQYGNLYRGKGAFANFLLFNGYVRKVFDLTYDPFEASRFIERDGIEFLNTFMPSEVEGTEGDAQPFLDFLHGLVPGDVEREHLLKMIAFTVRNPGRKLRHALVLRTAVQGVGKSMLVDIWGELLGPHNVRKTTSKELASDYQGYLPQRLLVVCEEMNLGMGAKAYNDMKDLITANTALVNEKHMRQREWPVYATFAFLSNLHQPLMIEANDRRIFYIDSPAERRDPEYYKNFAAWWQANLGVIRHYLNGIDLEGFNPHEAPPITASKRGLIAGSRSEFAQELALAITERHDCFDRDLVTLSQASVSLRLAGRQPSRSQLVRALGEVGAVPLGQRRVGGDGRASLWAIRNVDYWMFADADVLGQELTSATGMFAVLDGTGIEVVHMSRWPADPALLFLDLVVGGPAQSDRQGAG